MDPFEGSLNYAQQHQQHTRQVLRDRVLSNIEESPRRRTPTPLPEQARVNARSTSRERWTSKAHLDGDARVASKMKTEHPRLTVLQPR